MCDDDDGDDDEFCLPCQFLLPGFAKPTGGRRRNDEGKNSSIAGRWQLLRTFLPSQMKVYLFIEIFEIDTNLYSKAAHVF